MPNRKKRQRDFQRNLPFAGLLQQKIKKARAKLKKKRQRDFQRIFSFAGPGFPNRLFGKCYSRRSAGGFSEMIILNVTLEWQTQPKNRKSSLTNPFKTLTHGLEIQTRGPFKTLTQGLKIQPHPPLQNPNPESENPASLVTTKP